MLTTWIQAVYQFLWGDLLRIPLPGGSSFGVSLLIILLIPTGIYFTIRTRFLPVRLFGDMVRTLTGKKKEDGSLSTFQTLIVSTATRVGMGNLVGVVAAVSAGGAGAVFWMWLTGIFGIATKYSEIFVAIKYRVKDHNGNMLGGAMYAWQRGFTKNGKVPWYAKLGAVAFALFAAIAAIGTGSAVQASAMTGILTSSGIAIEPWIIGLVIAFFVAIVIFGGVQIISNVCEKLVPIMAIGYALGCLIILVFNWAYLWDAVVLIFECAFTAKAAFGGAVGSGIMVALQFGCARGLFSNESGLGSAPIVAAAAKTPNPAEQALIGMTGTFWSTVVICALTGVVLVSTMIAFPSIQEQILANPSVFSGAQLASVAFAQIPYIGTPLLVLGMISFSYSTILGWSYYGSRCITYLFGKRAIKPYQVIYVVVAFLGAIGVGDIVWTISDIGNALMAIPNIIMVLLLSGMIAKETKYYIYDDNLDEVDETPIPTVASK